MDILKQNFFFIPWCKSSKCKSRKHNGRTTWQGLEFAAIAGVEDIDTDQVNEN